MDYFENSCPGRTQDPNVVGEMMRAGGLDYVGSGKL